MKSCLAAITACALSLCMVLAWAHRFEPVDGARGIGPGDLLPVGEVPSGFRAGNGGMSIDGRKGRPGAVSFRIPAMADARHILVKFHAVAEGIEVGSERWDDGRLFIEWMCDGGVVGVSRVHSARGDQDTGAVIIVITAPKAGVEPVLHFQNLGHAGTFKLQDLELVAVRERAVWSVGKWVIGFGFLALIAVLAGGTKKPARWRGWVAALIWMLVAVHYVFPGPWDVARPFIVPFSISEVPAVEAGERVMDEVVTGAMDAFEEEPLMERLPPPSDIGLRLKQWLPWLRPMLHVALLFAPVLAMAWFVGARRAFWLGWALSLSIEAAQTLYGFGFGWDDVWDLIVNGIAIYAAVWAHRRFSARVHVLLPFPFPEPR